ncbi:hypothetical protein F4802DRAFT_617286 [Xylaria palmicola]|nr:hypothetical protein F4802DRAFT_617286 [Xylaria palmicola]
MGDALVLSAQPTEPLHIDKPCTAVVETVSATADDPDGNAAQRVEATTIAEDEQGKHEESVDQTVDQKDGNEQLSPVAVDTEPVQEENRVEDNADAASEASGAGQSGESVSDSVESIGVRGEQLRREHLKTHPLIVGWVAHDWEAFKHRYGDTERPYIIELLRAGPTTSDEIHMDMNRHVAVKHTPKSPADLCWIQRIRIQSPAIIAHLTRAVNQFPNSGDFQLESEFGHMHTFLRPFTSMMVLLPEMKLALERLEEKWANTESPTVTIEPDRSINEKAPAPDAEEGQTISPENSDEKYEPTADYPHAGMDDQTALEHMRCYVKFMDTTVVPLYDYFRDTSHKKVRFNDLALLFTPGELIYWPSAGSIMSVPYPSFQPVWRVFHSRRTKYGGMAIDDIDLCLSDTFHVCCYYIDHDGRSYGVMKSRIDFKCFEGEKTITDLPAYPFRFVENATRRLEEFKLQGELFRSYVKEHHLYYDGWSIPQELLKRSEDDSEDVHNYRRRRKRSDDTSEERYRRQKLEATTKALSSPEHVESPVIVDFDEAFKRHPEWKTTFRVPKESGVEWSWSHDPYDLSHWTDKTRAQPLYSAQELYMQGDAGIHLWKNDFIQKDVPISSSREDGLNKVSDEDLVLLPRRLVGYVLRDRKFLVLDILSLRSLLKQADMFKDLEIDPDHRRIVNSLVKAHFERRKIQKERPLLSLNQDLVYGKGAGLFILLHGMPGVGKTATAEAVAQRYNKPLFSITCGDIGASPREVEDELKEIFRLAHLWDCVLLLDEADVFLARRDISSLKRNALVSVFLRVLEYYSGILFLTTNRVGTIDEAFKSRIHLSLYYERLRKDQMLKIFNINLRKLREIEADKTKELRYTTIKEAELIIEDSKIIKFAKDHWKITPRHGRWNGRQIRNAFQIAASMARYDTGLELVEAEKKVEKKEEDGELESLVLDNTHFELVAEIMRRFDTYLELATGETDELSAYLDRARNDKLTVKDLISTVALQAPPSDKKRSSRTKKTREEDSDRPRKRKGAGKGRSRVYEEEAEKETRPSKAKGKSTKSDKAATRKKAVSPQRKPSSSKKTTTKNSTKSSGKSRSTKKGRDESEEEEDEEDTDEKSESEEEDSADEDSEDQSDDDDDEDEEESDDDDDDDD